MRKLLALLLTCMIVFALGGCGRREMTGLDQFVEDGVFVYPGLEWGMTPAEVSAVTGWPLEKAAYSSDGDDTYELHEIPYGGEEWTAQVQFMRDGGLWCVSLLQEGKIRKAEKLFDSMDADFTEMLGEPDPGHYRMIKEYSDRRMIISEANWKSASEEDPSRMQLYCSYQEGQDTAFLGLIVMHPAHGSEN